MSDNNLLLLLLKREDECPLYLPDCIPVTGRAGQHRHGVTGTHGIEGEWILGSGVLVNID